MNMYEQAARVVANSKPRGECLIWQGAVNDRGYGYVKIDGKQWLVHRLVAIYGDSRRNERATENLKPFRVVQSCDNKLCVQLKHLKFGYKLDKGEKLDKDEMLGRMDRLLASY